MSTQLEIQDGDYTQFSNSQFWYLPGPGIFCSRIHRDTSIPLDYISHFSSSQLELVSHIWRPRKFNLRSHHLNLQKVKLFDNSITHTAFPICQHPTSKNSLKWSSCPLSPLFIHTLSSSSQEAFTIFLCTWLT